MSLIELDHVTYRYESASGAVVTALDDLSLRIEEGEFVALVGANGSGKTTLARHLNALFIPSSGTVRVAGMDTREARQHAAIRAMVGMVFQNPEDQLVAGVVEEDVAFGMENLGRPAEEIRQRVSEMLLEFDLWEARQRPPHLLSAGQMQRLALAGVLVMRPRVLVFDETTAMLDPAGRRKVMEIVRQLHAEGVTVVYVTHLMREAVQAQRMVVLSHGRVAADGTPEEIFARRGELRAWGLRPPLAALLAERLHKRLPELPEGILTGGRLMDALPVYGGALALPAGADGAVPPALREAAVRVEELGHIYLRGTPLAHRALSGVSLEIGEGQSYGLAGGTGSGKSTLLQHMNGLLRPQEGRVWVGPHALHSSQPDLQAVRRRAGLVFQSPEYQLFETYVGDEIAFGPRQLGWERARVRESVAWAMEMVGLNFAAYKDRLTFGLSGGERKKVTLASLLAMRPAVLLLDEPVAGLDPLARADLLGRLRQLRGEGVTLVMTSHQMEDLGELVEGLSVLKKGRDALRGPARWVLAQDDALREAGLEAPLPCQVAARLRERGWPLGEGLVSEDELVAAVDAAQVGGA